MIALTENAVKVGNLIDYAVGVLPGIVLEVTKDYITVLTADFETKQLPVSAGHWIGVVGSRKVGTITNINSGITHRTIDGVIVCGARSTQDEIAGDKAVTCEKCKQLVPK